MIPLILAAVELTIEAAPFVEGAVEVGGVAMDGLATRTALKEAGTAVLSQETRQELAFSFREVAVQLASKEGREALVKQVAENSARMSSEAAETLSSKEGRDALGKAATKYEVKHEVGQEVKDASLNKVTEMTQDQVMGMVMQSLENGKMTKEMQEFVHSPAFKEMSTQFAGAFAATGVASYLAKDMHSLSGSLGKEGDDISNSLSGLSKNLQMSKDALPHDKAQVEALQGKVDTLSQINDAQEQAKTELAETGQVSPATLDTLKQTIEAATHSADKTSAKHLENAQEQLAALGPNPSKNAVLDALSEVSVAKDGVMKEVTRDTTNMTAKLDKNAEHMQGELDAATKPLIDSKERETQRDSQPGFQQDGKAAEQAHEQEQVQEAQMQMEMMAAM